MNQISSTITVVLKAVALALAVASVVLGMLNVAALTTQVTLLGLGLFVLVLAGFQKTPEEHA